MNQSANKLIGWSETAFSYDEPPNRDFDARDWQCRSCEWRTTCGNVVVEEPAITFGKEKISEEEIADAFRLWEENKLESDSHKQDEDQDKYMRAILMRYLTGLGAEKMVLKGQAGDWNVTVRDRPMQKVNVELVRYYLTKSQQEEVISYSSNPFIEIRKARRKA